MPYVSAQDTARVGHVEWWSEGALVNTVTSLVYGWGTISRTVAFEVRAWDRLGNESSPRWPYGSTRSRH
jgi:hypothetical protein